MFSSFARPPIQKALASPLLTSLEFNPIDCVISSSPLEFFRYAHNLSSSKLQPAIEPPPFATKCPSYDTTKLPLPKIIRGVDKSINIPLLFVLPDPTVNIFLLSVALALKE